MGASQSRRRSLLNLTHDPCTCSSAAAEGPCGAQTVNGPLSDLAPSGVHIDHQTYKHVAQDVTVVKTLLFRLKQLLQDSDVVMEPSENLSPKNGYIKLNVNDLVPDDSIYAEFSKEDFHEENSALRTQVALLRQEIDQKNWLILGQTLRLERLEKLVEKISLTQRISGGSSLIDEPQQSPKSKYLPDLLH